MAHIPAISPGLQEWNDEVEKAKAQLHPDEDGTCYVMSVTRRKQGVVGGVLSVVTLTTAAKLLAGESHIEATPEQVAAWRADQDIRRKKQMEQAVKQDAKFNLDLGPVAEILLKLGMQAGQGSAPVVPAPTPAPVAAAEPAKVNTRKPVQSPVAEAHAERF